MSRRSAAARRLVDTAPLFAALGDATRLRMVARLCDEGPLSTAALTDVADMSRQAIAKHLRVLEDAGLLRSGRAGRERIWELETKRLADIRRHLEQISAQWDEAIERLRRMVESDER
jgi:DNA-binding transcriptional ArsR family regulator